MANQINPLNDRPYSQRYGELLEQRRQLPVWNYKKQFLDLLNKNQYILVVGETGSGKTTQIPQWCMDFARENGGKLGKKWSTSKVCCTQPRRLAAASVAKRVAEELDVSLGQQVGYSTRFEDRVSDRTVLKYCTDGNLLREAMKSPLLAQYRVIVLDEVHERKKATEILMGLIKEKIIPKRSNLKIVVMSASLDAPKFRKYFNDCPLLAVPGRTFPIEYFYLTEPERDYRDIAVELVIGIHVKPEAGDILIFLTGPEAIEYVCQNIRRKWNQMKNEVGELTCIPLHSMLPPQEQERVFGPAPPNKPNGAISRKCIVASNIAETSLTIDGVAFVIDSEFSNLKVYSPKLKAESFLPTPISKALAMQRAGRAGRTKAGKCYRLYTKQAYIEVMKEHTDPEITRSNLVDIVLQMKKLQIEDIVRFDYMDPPAGETYSRAVEVLNHLSAIDDNKNLTPLGELMADFPLDPPLAKMLIASTELGCSNEILTIAAMLSVPPCFARPCDPEKRLEAKAAHLSLAHVDGDHLTLLNVFNAFIQNCNSVKWCNDNFVNSRVMCNADQIRKQLVKLMDQKNLQIVSSDYSKPDYYDNIKKALVAGFFMQVAHLLKNDSYLDIASNQLVKINPSSMLDYNPDWVLYNELVLSMEHSIRTVTIIRPKWLLEMAPNYYHQFPDKCKAIKHLEDVIASLRIAKDKEAKDK